MIKKIFKILALFVFCLIFTKGINAATVGIGASSTNVTVGNNFTIYINVSGGSFMTVGGTLSISNASIIKVPAASASYNSNTGRFSWVSTDAKTSGTIISIPFTASAPGTVNFTTTNIDATDGSNSISAGGSSVGVTISTPVVVAPPPTPTTTNTTTPTKTTTAPTTTTTSKSSNANLSSLKVNQQGLSPTFNKSKMNYSLSVPQGVTTINVTAIAEDSGAKVSVSGNTNLVDGDNKINILVTAANGTKKTYTITVTKSGDPDKSNAYLENMIIDNSKISPEFLAENLEYTCENVKSDVEKLEIRAFPKNKAAKVEITGNDKLVEGENIIKVKVTAVDGTTTKEYTIKVTKEAAPATEVNVYPEVNSLQDTSPSKFSNFLHGIWNFIKNFSHIVWSYIKSFWIVLSLLAVCLFELWEIITQYRKSNNNKEEITDNSDLTKIENKKKLDKVEDKNFSFRRRSSEIEDENKKSLLKMFNSKDKDIEDNK